MAFTFAINNYFDFKSDMINPRRKYINAIASGNISKKNAILILILLVIIPLILSAYLSLEIFLFCCFLLFLGWAYSSPPLRTKNIPAVDVVWHFIGFFCYVLWGSLIAGNSIYQGSIDPFIILMGISLGIFSSIGQIGNHLNDYESDKKTGTVTFAVWAGIEKSKKALNVVTALHLIVLIPLIVLYCINYYLTIIVLLFLIIIGFLILRPKKGMFPTNRCFIYFITVVIGGSVYLSCLVYHILFILGTSPIIFIVHNVINNVIT
jgi:4-hydroxybenzoate polyprenyltransferase